MLGGVAQVVAHAAFRDSKIQQRLIQGLGFPAIIIGTITAGLKVYFWYVR
jgi:hypothetical protein